MKRFIWPLEQLLKVTVQRERTLKAEVFHMSHQIATVHGEILRRQTVMRSAVAEFGRMEIQERMAGQESFAQAAASEQKRLRELGGKLQELRRQRDEKMKAFAKEKTSREMLEKLRQEAFERHTKENLKLEQQQLDEHSQVTFASRLMNRKAASPQVGG